MNSQWGMVWAILSGARLAQSISAPLFFIVRGLLSWLSPGSKGGLQRGLYQRADAPIVRRFPHSVGRRDSGVAAG